MPRTITRNYASLREFAEHCRDSERVWTVRESELCTQGGAEWYGSDSLPEAIEWAMNGTWPNAEIDKFDKVLSETLGNPEQRLSFENQVAGCRPDIGAFCAGEPACMLVPEFQETDRRVLRLLVSRAASCGISGDELSELGRTLLSIVAELESDCGVSVEIVVHFGHRLAHGNLDHEYVTIKRAGEPLDLSEIAFALVSPAMIRRLSFKSSETLPREFQEGSYGCPLDAPADVIAEYDIHIPRHYLGNLDKVRKAFDQFLADTKDVNGG